MSLACLNNCSHKCCFFILLVFYYILEVILNIFDYFWPLQCKSRVTLRGRDEPGGACDGVLLDVVAALELDAGRGRDDWHGHAVPPALLVSPGPGHQQQVLVLGLQTRLGRVNIIFYGLASHATSTY